MNAPIALPGRFAGRCLVAASLAVAVLLGGCDDGRDEAPGMEPSPSPQLPPAEPLNPEPATPAPSEPAPGSAPPGMPQPDDASPGEEPLGSGAAAGDSCRQTCPDGSVAQIDCPVDQTAVCDCSMEPKARCEASEAF